MLNLILAAGLAGAPPQAPAPAVAPPPIVKIEAAPAAKPTLPKFDDFATMMKLFDKVFPPQPDPEPARLARGRVVAQAMWPDGVYGELTESFLTSIADVVLDMKPSDLEMLKDKAKDDEKEAKDGKAAPKTPAKPKAPDITLREKMRQDDSHFDARVALITAAVHDELKSLSPLIEPPLREGLARALARRFTEPQLNDLQAFFASPTGQLYARQSIKLWFDGDVMRASMNSMPALMIQMPRVFERVKAAADTLPPPPKKAKPKAGAKKD